MNVKKIASVSMLLLCSIVSWSQQRTPNRLESEDIIDLRIRISNGAKFLSDDSGPAGIEMENTSDRYVPLLYTSSLWIGAEDNEGTLHLGAMTYRQRGDDFYPGPISDDSVQTSSHYNNIYRITWHDIKEHQNDPGSVQAINEWPGNGNVALGEPNIIAPFVDLNNNSIYEPESGDYPQIRGDIAFFTIFNDKGEHSHSGAEPLEVDVRMMVYAFYFTPELENQVFVHYSIENRSDNDYSNAYFGIFNDYDLGNYSDDYVGTDSLNSMIFTYNQDNNDEGISGFGFNPPAFGMKWLSHPMDVSKMFENSRSEIYGNPQIPQDYYHYLTGLNMDGSAVLDPNGSATKFEYYGDVSNQNDWHEYSEGSGVSDKRSVSSIGPLNFNKGDVQCFDVVYVYARSSDLTTAHLVNVNELKKKALVIQEEFDQRNIQDDFSFCQDKFNSTEKISVTKVECYPNPTTDVVHVDMQKHTNEVTSILVIDALGKQFTVQPTHNNHVEIPLHHMANGVYQIVIVADEQRFVGRFIKQ